MCKRLYPTKAGVVRRVYLYATPADIRNMHTQIFPYKVKNTADSGQRGESNTLLVRLCHIYEIMRFVSHHAPSLRSRRHSNSKFVITPTDRRRSRDRNSSAAVLLMRAEGLCVSVGISCALMLLL